MEEDELDPRIQVELEKLNNATDDINKLEIELDEANTTFRMLLNECTRRLKVHSSRYGSAIESARPYYEALDIARRAQQECQQAAVSFQRANEVHVAAKETVALAESRFLSQQPEWRFDSAWQEMLNHATIKVRDAEKQRAESSVYHSQTTAIYKDAQEKVHLLEQRLRRNVAKSRPYFEEKQRCNEQLAAQKEAVETLAAKVARVKAEYAESLRQLEGISEEIHRKRANVQLGGCGVREPGVGAELEYKEELEYCVRETAFDKSSFSCGDKPDAAGPPDASFSRQAAVTDYSEIDLGRLDEDATLDPTADDDIWLDVEVGRNSFVLPSSGSDELPVRMNPDDQTGCDIHGRRFEPTDETGVDTTGDGADSSVLKEDEATSVRSTTPTGTGTPTRSIIQGTNGHDEVRQRSEQPRGEDEASVEDLNICVQEVQQDQKKQPEICDDNNSAFCQENGAIRFNNGDITSKMEENTESSDLQCDYQAQVCTDVKINRPTLVGNANGTNESLDVVVSDQGLNDTEGNDGSTSVLAGGDAGEGRGSSSGKDLAPTTEGTTERSVDESPKDTSRSGPAFHPGSRPADLELTWTPDKTPQEARKDITGATGAAAEDSGDHEGSVGICTDQAN